ncbi:hypothetical protein [Acetobacter sp. AAB5]|uniref:hypothetical protein n=1 Tax=Acetobacter sp. AAB5 TaxID=3418370 RepID=UPI003CE91268
MSRNNSFVKNGFLAVFYALLVSCFVVGICEVRFPSFFTIDDSQNEYLGFLRQYGQTWLSGEIPFITKNIFIGDNAMVELQRGIFAPQNILASLVTCLTTNPLITGWFYALCNVFICCISGYIIGRSLEISRDISLLLGFSIAINPVFLYQYAGPWWNAANGHAWSLLAIATYCQLRQRITTGAVIANFAATLVLLASGWPHGFIGYLAVVAGFSCVDLAYGDPIKVLFRRCVPLLLAGIAAIPVYSEYVFLHPLLNRATGWENADNFMVPSLSQLLVTFSPTYYEFMNYFGGYKSVFIPVGFSTLFALPVAIFFRTSVRDRVLAACLIILGITTALALMPSQMGILRWPLRFVPYVSVFAAITTFYVFSKKDIVESSVRRNVFFGITALLFVVSASKNVFERPKVVALELLTSIALVAVWFLYARSKKITGKDIGLIIPAAIPVFSLLLMLASMPSLGRIYLPVNVLPSHVSVPASVNMQGNLLSFAPWGREHPKEAADLQSSLFGYYNIRALNGYSPNGQDYTDAILTHDTSHTIFKPDDIIPKLASAVMLPGNPCLFDLFAVSSMVVSSDTYQKYHHDLLACGYHKVATAPSGMLYLSTPKTYPSNLAYSTQAGVTVERETANSMTFSVPAHTAPVQMVLSRQWWPGYTAQGLNCKVNVSGFQDVLVQVDVPAGCSGKLTVSYFPHTWPLALVCLLMGVLGLVAFLWQLSRERKLQLILQMR